MNTTIEETKVKAEKIMENQLSIYKGNFPILFSPIDIGKALQENLGGEQIAARELFFTAKIPSGGSTEFEMVDSEGEETTTKEIKGIILHIGHTRSYHRAKYSDPDADPIPNCSSEDGIVGIGEPGGDCSSCPLNEYGTAENKRAKACCEYKPLYMLTPGIARPIAVRISPGSFKALNNHLINLSMSGVQKHQVETVISLKKVKGNGGPDFSQAIVKKGDRINNAKVLEQVESYRAGILPFLDPNHASRMAGIKAINPVEENNPVEKDQNAA